MNYRVGTQGRIVHGDQHECVVDVKIRVASASSEAGTALLPFSVAFQISFSSTLVSQTSCHFPSNSR